MRKKASLALVALLAAATARGQPIPVEPFGFIAWNPGAALSFFRTGFATRSILPTALFNQEAGIALAGGWCRRSGLAEGRVALGNSNATYFVAQVQLGASWFLGEHFGWLRKGPYVGGSLRYWDLVQLLTEHEIRLEQIVTDRFGLEEALEAFRLFDSGDTGQVVFEWD